MECGNCSQLLPVVLSVRHGALSCMTNAYYYGQNWAQSSEGDDKS